MNIYKKSTHVAMQSFAHRRSCSEVISAKIGSIMPTLLNLLHALRVSLIVLRTCSLNLFAIRTRFVSSVRKFAPAEEGFTLAEVLITLGIIGVVAALTIPGLIAKYQKEATVNKLKRSISILNQAYKLSYDDVGELSAQDSKDLDSLGYFNTYWAPYIKVHTYCQVPQQCGYNTYQPFTTANNQKGGWYVVEPRLRSTFMTPDGFVYVIILATWSGGDGSTKKEEYQVIVDINGGEKPNKYGKDVFVLSRTQTDGGGIRPYCYEKTDKEVNINCSIIGNGDCCAEKIRRAGWKIDNSYPWKG